MNYEQAKSFLYDRLNFESTTSIPYGEAEFKLDRMRDLVARLGNPHLGKTTIHVAGTKGKGSTCHFLSGMLKSAGYRVGCYTSPHLDHIEERFAINQQPCSSEQFVELVEQIQATTQAMDREASAQGTVGPTFFELTTAMAMLHFHRHEVDVSILEVGLGGRLDSTNICEPKVCVITSISFDHMRQLGNTLALIAGEKAGIIKPGVPVVTGVVDSEPLQVIQRIASERSAPLRQLGADFDFEYTPTDFSQQLPSVDFHNLRKRSAVTDVTLSTFGTHQAANAALAWEVCDLLEEQSLAKVDIDARRRGLRESHCPGRIEVVGNDPTLVIDTAHNAASIDALVQVIRESIQVRPRTLILAATQGKQVDSMLLSLVPEFDTLLCTQYQNNPRAMPVEQLTAAAERAKQQLASSIEIVQLPTPGEAWTFAQNQTPRPNLVVATGSFFLAAEMRIAESEKLRALEERN